MPDVSTCLPPRRTRRKAAFAIAVAGKLVWTLFQLSPAVAQEAASQTAQPQADAAAQEAQQENLQKKLANPISDLVSVPFQYNWIQGVGDGGQGLRTVLNIQPVVPFTLSPKWNLIERWRSEERRVGKEC